MEKLDINEDGVYRKTICDLAGHDYIIDMFSFLAECRETMKVGSAFQFVVCQCCGQYMCWIDRRDGLLSSIPQPVCDLLEKAMITGLEHINNLPSKFNGFKRFTTILPPPAST